MITLEDEWKREMTRIPCERVWLVEIDAKPIAGGANKTFKFSSSDASLILPDGVTPNVRYTSCVSTVRGLGHQIHPLTREWTPQTVDITFLDDGHLRNIIKSYYLLGKVTKVKLGCKTLSNWDKFQLTFQGVVSGLESSEGSIVLSCGDMLSLLGSKPFTGSYIGRHPAHMVLELLKRADIPTSFYSASDFTPDNHFVIGRMANPRTPGKFSVWNQINASRIPTEPQTVAQMIGEICKITYSTFLFSADGKYKFKSYSDTAAVVATLTLADIMDFKPEKLWDNVVTSVRIVIDESVDTSAEDHHSYYLPLPAADPDDEITLPKPEVSKNAIVVEIEDRSIAGVFGAGSLEFRSPHELQTNWIVGNTEGFMYRKYQAGAPLDPDSPYGLSVSRVDAVPGILLPEDGDNALLLLQDCSVNAMSGTATNDLYSVDAAAGGSGPNKWVQPNAPQNVTSARTLVLLMTDARSGDQELIEIDEFKARDIARELYNEYSDVGVWGGSNASVFHPVQWGAVIKARDLEGTAIAWTTPGQPPASRALGTYNMRELLFTDVTIAYSTAKKILKRFRKGAPIYLFRTDISHFGIEVGDAIVLPAHKLPVDHGSDGLSGILKYEVIRKELVIDGDSPAIQWAVCEMIDEATVTLTPAIRREIIPTFSVIRLTNPSDVVDNGVPVHKTADDILLPAEFLWSW